MTKEVITPKDYMEPFVVIATPKETEQVNLYTSNWPLAQRVKAIFGIINGDIVSLQREIK